MAPSHVDKKTAWVVPFVGLWHLLSLVRTVIVSMGGSFEWLESLSTAVTGFAAREGGGRDYCAVDHCCGRGAITSEREKPPPTRGMGVYAAGIVLCTPCELQ